MKKFAVITSTRAEYGLLSPLIRHMMEHDIKVHLLVSGTHLLSRFGNTVEYIRQDGFTEIYEIPVFEEDFRASEEEAAEAIGKAAALTARQFMKESYDAVIVLGDRYELLGFCSAAVVCRVPIIHIHGGEITEGAIDDKIRHALTKLASVHFPSVPAYAKRIVQMGENPEHVYPVGALGIDNILSMKLMERGELLESLGIRTNLPIAAVTFHPVTTESPECAAAEIEIVIESLLKSWVYAVITMPNSDAGSSLIEEHLRKAVNRFPERMCLKKSLGQVRYLSLLKHADIMIGNSSSGIIESASFRLPAVDIGDRQKGRLRPANVIHCDCILHEILEAVRKGLSPEFRESLKDYVNPYGDGHAAERITAVLRKLDLSRSEFISKKFYDWQE